MNITKIIPAPNAQGLYDQGAMSWGMVQAGPLSGPGVALQYPQNLYPSELYNAPFDYGTNQVCLNAGDQVPIPRGDWLVGLGSYSVLQYLDPCNGTWIIVATAAWDSGLIYLQSDGFNYRVANLTGCAVGGIVNTIGAGYTQAGTAISTTAASPLNTGASAPQFTPIVGGQLTMFSVTAVGAGYGVSPIMILPAPAGPTTNANGVGGLQASGYCVITNGTVSGFTFTNPGAGYAGSAFTVVALANPTDPNINTGITLASLAFSVTAAGSITGVLCNNPGAPQTTPNNVTLTVTGAQTTQATVSAIMCQTVINVTVVGGPATVTGLGTGTALITSVGGYPVGANSQTPATGTITSAPVYLTSGVLGAGTANQGLWARPRPLQASYATNVFTASASGTIYDGGLFFGPPTPLTLTGGTLVVAAASIIGTTATIVLTMGSRPDFVTLQPLRV